MLSTTNKKPDDVKKDDTKKDEDTKVEKDQGDQKESKKKAAKPEKIEGGQIFTYVGAGEDSPRVINFMGKHKFIRGQAAAIADPELLSKIVGNPSFVEGEVDQETLHIADEQAKADADEQRKADAAANARFHRKFKRPEKGEA